MSNLPLLLFLCCFGVGFVSRNLCRPAAGPGLQVLRGPERRAMLRHRDRRPDHRRQGLVLLADLLSHVPVPGRTYSPLRPYSCYDSGFIWVRCPAILCQSCHTGHVLPCGAQMMCVARTAGLSGGHCRCRVLTDTLDVFFGGFWGGGRPVVRIWCVNGIHQAPAGATAKPQCVLEKPPSQQPSQCALICSPLGSKDQCPPKASCKKIQTTGLCTYDT